MKKKTVIYELNIYLKGKIFKYYKFCSLEFSSIEKARTYMSNIALADKIVTFDDLSFNLKEFHHAVIKEVKR